MAESLDLGDLIFRLGFDSEAEFLRALDRVFDRADQEAKSSGKKAGSSFAKDFQGALGTMTLGSFLGNTLANAFSSALGATKQFVSDSNREFQSYQISLNIIAASGAENLDKIKASIKELSDEGKVFSENQIAQALAEVIKAGYDTNSALLLVSSGAQAAKGEIDPLTGSYADLAQVTLLVSDVLSGFGIDAKDAGRVTDILAKAANESKLQFSELVQAVAPISGLASQVGLSLEQTAAAIAQLRSTGLPAAEAATALRTVLSQLIAPPQELKKTFDALGLSILKADGTSRKFPEILDNIARAAASGKSGVDFLGRAFGTYGLNAVLALQKSRAQLNQFSDDLKDSEGAAKKWADEVNGNGVEAAKNYERQIANAKRELGEELKPIMVDFYTNVAPAMVSGLGTIVTALNTVIEALGRAKVSAAQWAKDYGIALTQAQAARVQTLLQSQSQIEGQIKLLEQQKANPLQQLVPGMENILQGRINVLKAQLGEIRKQLILAQKEAALAGREVKPVSTTSTATPAAPVVKPFAPSQFPATGGTKGKKPEDPIIKAADSLKAQVELARNLAERGGGIEALLGKPAELAAYEKSLQNLENRLKGLYSSAKSVDQKNAVLSVLNSIDEEQKKIAEAQKARQDKARKEQIDKNNETADALLANAARQAELENKQREERLAKLKADLEAQQKAYLESDQANFEARKKAEEDRQKRLPETVLKGLGIGDVFAANLDDLYAARDLLEQFGLTQNETYQNIGEAIKLNIEVELDGQERLDEARKQSAADYQKLQEDEQKAAELLEKTTTEALQRQQELIQQVRADIEASFNIDEGLAGFNQRLEFLQIQLENNQISAEEFNSELDFIKETLEGIANLALKENNLDLFIRANQELQKIRDINAEKARREAEAQTALSNAQKELNRLLGQSEAPYQAEIDRLEELKKQYPSLIAQLDLLIERYKSLRAEIQRGSRERSPADLPGSHGGKLEDKSDQTAEDVRKKAEALTSEIQNLFLNAGKSLVDGIRQGKPLEALQGIFGNATDFFVNKMVEGILGPIAEELAAVVAKKLFTKTATGALSLNPAGLAVGAGLLGISLLSGLLNRPSPTAQEAAKSTRSGLSSVSLKVETAISVAMEGSLDNAANRASLTTLVEGINTAQLRKLGVFELLEELKRSRS